MAGGVRPSLGDLSPLSARSTGSSSVTLLFIDWWYTVRYWQRGGP